MKKTTPVAELKAYVNARLESNITEEARQALCLLLEKILFETKQYNGFNYVEWLRTGFDKWTADGRPEDNAHYIGPEYKRHYY